MAQRQVWFVRCGSSIKGADTWLQEAKNHVHLLFVLPFG